MKRFVRGLVAALTLAFLWTALPAHAQQGIQGQVAPDCSTPNSSPPVGAFSWIQIDQATHQVCTNATNGGTSGVAFHQTGKATLAATNVSANTALPDANPTVVVYNPLGVNAHIQLFSGGGTATVTDFTVPAGAIAAINNPGGAYGSISYILDSSSGNLLLWTGTGLLNAIGGSGSGGGGGAITAADGAIVVEGAKGTDTACASYSTTGCTILSVLKELAQQAESGAPTLIGSNQSGSTAAVVGCDSHAFYDASDNGKKTVVAGVSAKKIYVCGYTLATGGTATNLSLTSGTGSDCVTTSTAITPAYQLVANDRVGANAAFWNGLVTLNNADNLCVNASAANAHQVEIWYTIK